MISDKNRLIREIKKSFKKIANVNSLKRIQDQVWLSFILSWAEGRAHNSSEPHLGVSFETEAIGYLMFIYFYL